MNGSRWQRGIVVAVCGAALAAPAFAQAPAAGAQQSAARAAAGQRYQLAVMEGVLEAAVQQGARVVSRQWRAVSSEMLFVNGNARARGVHLDNYGMFFDVAVPAMRQSVAWTWRVLERDSATTMAQTLKGLSKTVTDPGAKKELDQIIRTLELQSRMMGRPSNDPLVVAQGGAPRGTGGIVAPAGGAVQEPDEDMVMVTEDPNIAYTNEVKKALIDAMLDHSHALPLAADDWLTVAAHDDADRSIGMSDPYESVTMLFRIKGADLQALRAGRMTREEARRRVEVREY